LRFSVGNLYYSGLCGLNIKWLQFDYDSNYISHTQVVVKIMTLCCMSDSGILTETYWKYRKNIIKKLKAFKCVALVSMLLITQENNAARLHVK